MTTMVIFVLLCLLFTSCTSNTIDCFGTQSCKDDTKTCNSGELCDITCDGTSNGEQACQDATLNGSSATNVTLNCIHKQDCQGSKLICGTGICSIRCHTNTNPDHTEQCKFTRVDCAESTCKIECDGPDSCFKDSKFVLTNAISFECSGYCPDTYPPPTHRPTNNHTIKPTNLPTVHPTKAPIIIPTNIPTKYPTNFPTKYPTNFPTKYPTNFLTNFPSKYDTLSPTSAPTQLPAPTSRPTTSAPTRTSITANPSITPTKSPIKSPTNNPSILPTRNPSSITYTTQPTKSPAIAYPTISSSANPTINSVLRTNVPNESDTINPTKLSSVIPSVSSTKKSTLTTTVSDGITSTEKSVQESNENDISYLGLGMPLWMNAVIGFGIICCLLIVLMLCIRKRNKKSYVNFESPDVNENDEQIVVRTDTHETHSNNSIKAEFNMGDLGASNSNLCEKNTFERGLMNNCVVSDILMEEIVDNMDTRGNIEMSNNNNNIVAAQGESMDIQDSIEDINNNINDEQVMLQEIIKMANDTKVTAEGDNNI